MNERQVSECIRDASRHRWPIKAVLLAKGGWVSARSILIEDAFTNRHIPVEPTVWKILLFSDDDVLVNTIYVESETIVGISVNRSTPHANTDGYPPHIADGGY